MSRPMKWLDATVAERIRDGMPVLTRSEKRVAQTLLANYPLQGLETAAQFAQSAGVSTPSVLRFASRIGFASYSDFQRRLKEEVEARLQSPLAKTRGDPSAIAPVQPFGESVAENIVETFRHLPASDLEAVAALLSDPRRPLHLLGGRFTDPLARYMTAHMRILRPNVSHIEGQRDNWHDQLIDMGPRDVLFLIDIRRYQADLTDFAVAAAKRRVTAILLTDQWLSPAARVAKFTCRRACRSRRPGIPARHSSRSSSRSSQM